MRGSTVKRDQKAMQLFVKRNGTTVLLEWLEWPNGKPEEDVTGSSVATVEQAAVKKTCQCLALTHQIAPLENKVRMHAELTLGNAMLDFAFPFYRITSAGDTNLAVGQVVDQLALNKANREMNGEEAEGDEISLSTLGEITATFNGQKWVQCEVGDALKASLDAVHADIQFASTIVVRRLP